MALLIITTKDGSHTIQVSETGDTYHSVHGAVQESNHVFIKAGLKHFISKSNKTEIKILEVGFGTGLNALLTLNAMSDNSIHVEYTSLEPFPLINDQYSRLNYADANNKFIELHTAEWNELIQITPSFSLHKINSTIQAVKLPDNYFDVVYFDAFAPNSQPEMWAQDVLMKLKNAMTTDSVLVTYCAKGQVKRDLKSVGFTIESLPGPPGKREMVRALKF